jgi:hypothetical protein
LKAAAAARGRLTEERRAETRKREKMAEANTLPVVFAYVVYVTSIRRDSREEGLFEGTQHLSRKHLSKLFLNEQGGENDGKQKKQECFGIFTGPFLRGVASLLWFFGFRHSRQDRPLSLLAKQ